MSRTALVVGGTGPTGPHVLAGLIGRGYDVTIYHRGVHEPGDIPQVRHIHGDPHFADSISADLGDASYDLVVAAYGRTRHVAEVMKGRCEQFIAIGGAPRYVGFYDPERQHPAGLPVPVREDHSVVRDVAPDASAAARFAAQLVATEDAVFAAIPHATYLIYPYMYGPRNILPVEWSVIQRVLDLRRRLLLPDGGAALLPRGASRNMAHCVLLAVDGGAAAAGEVFNCADDVQLTLRQWVQVILEGMGAEVELVDVPAVIAPHFKAVYLPNSEHMTTHCVFDTAKVRSVLGYRDVVGPVAALNESVAWWQSHPVDPVNPPAAFVDRFDYALEDAVMQAWMDASATLMRAQPQPAVPEVHPMPHPKEAGRLADQRGR